MSAAFENARDAAAHGLRVFPLHSVADGVCTCRKSECGQQGKHPRTARGLTDASADERTLLHWNDRWPDANWGLVCGEVTVIDMDPKHGADPRELIGEHQLTDRPGVWTGAALSGDLEGNRGAHAYCAGGTPTGSAPVAGVHIRGVGAYVVLPGSRHLSGVTYEWMNGARPWTVALKPIPAALAPQAAGGGQAPVPRDRVPHGRRHEHLRDFAVRLTRADVTDVETLLAHIKVEFAERCAAEPPPDAASLKKLAEWAARNRIAERERKRTGSRFGRYLDSHRQPSEDEPDASSVQFTRASSVRAKPVQWLIPGRVPLGGVTMLAGDPKLGKSALTCLYGAGISRGAHGHEPGITAFASAEDTLAHVIKPRLHAAGANLDLVGTVAVQDGEHARGLQLPGDIGELDAFVAQTGARLLVIDPLNAHLAGQIDSWKDHGIRAALAPLSRLAENHQIAVIAVVHLNKQKGGDPLYRPNGSIGYVGAARSLLAFGRDPDDPDGEQGKRRLLGHLGGNWGVQVPTQVYEIEGVSVKLDDDLIDTVRLRYVEDVDAAAGAAFGTRANEDRGVDCEEAIAEHLGDLQPHPSREVKSAVMAELDVSEPTVKRAARRMTDRGELLVHERGVHLGPGQARRSTAWQLAPNQVNPIANDDPTREPPISTGDLPSRITDGNGGDPDTPSTNLLGEDTDWRDRFVRENRERP
jgi:AAA domain/Bifunctional DNA primase/polymerase, N-terminal